MTTHDGQALKSRHRSASPPLCPARYPPLSVAACRYRAARRILSRMGTKSRETIYGASIRAAAERATEARKEADRLSVEAWNIVRRPKSTPIHELERYVRCKDCSQVRGYPYKRSHLVALRPTKISASDPPSTWWPGER
jgi:hypothetical protein